jgi:hypothetical protein
MLRAGGQPVLGLPANVRGLGFARLESEIGGGQHGNVRRDELLEAGNEIWQTAKNCTSEVAFQLRTARRCSVAGQRNRDRKDCQSDRE